METVVHKDVFLLARMKAVPSGQTSVNQGQKLIRSKGKISRMSDCTLVVATDGKPHEAYISASISRNGHKRRRGSFINYVLWRSLRPLARTSLPRRQG
jgi:hypothetical protein